MQLGMHPVSNLSGENLTVFHPQSSLLKSLSLQEGREGAFNPNRGFQSLALDPSRHIPGFALRALSANTVT